jgi:lipid-binding SYLF domain-containing protein
MLLAASALVLASLAVPADAQAAGTPVANDKTPAANQPYLATDTVQQVNDAKAVVERMKSDPAVKDLLQKARGVFILPTYGRGAWGLGVRGGEGVMLTHSGGKWSNPVFYNMGGVSIGLQGGVEAGALAMLLMSDKAVNQFMSENNFSLNAGIGLTIVNYTAKAQADLGKGDVIVWADTKGAFANASVGVSDIRLDEGDTKAFYKRTATAKEILDGAVTSSQADALKQALPTGK